MSKRIVIVGASSSISEHCARLWIQEKNVTLVLIGRNQQKLNAIASDLLVREPSTQVDIQTGDFFDPGQITAMVNQIAKKGSIDIALIAQGFLSDQSACQNDLSLLNQALQINAISPALFAEAFATQLQQQGHGSLAIIGSVAGDRGRQSNYSYGAAKGLIARYAEGLQHRYAGTAIHIAMVKPGPTDTPMTANLKSQGLALAPVDQVAKAIVRGIEQKKAVIYAPKKWALIMLIIRHLPRFIFNRMKV